METVNKGTELLINIKFGELDLNSLKNIKATYYTTNSKKVECTLTNGKIVMYDAKLCAKLETADTEDFSGVLKSDIAVEFNNDCFSDGGQLIEKTMYLNVNFK